MLATSRGSATTITTWFAGSCGAIADIDCAVGEAPCLTPADANNVLDGFVLDEAEVIYWGSVPRLLDCRFLITARFTQHSKGMLCADSENPVIACARARKRARP